MYQLITRIGQLDCEILRFIWSLVSRKGNAILVRKRLKEMKTRSFTVLVYKEDDTYIAECPEVGTVDQGETIEQAIAGLKEATRLYLEEFPLPEKI